jgi:hypothetical protein
MNKVPSYCALEDWRAQYASPVVDTTVVGPQYGTTTMLAILAQAQQSGGSYRIQRYIGLTIAMHMARSGLECTMCLPSGCCVARQLTAEGANSLDNPSPEPLALLSHHN